MRLIISLLVCLFCVNLVEANIDEEYRQRVVASHLDYYQQQATEQNIERFEREFMPVTPSSLSFQRPIQSATPILPEQNTKEAIVDEELDTVQFRITTLTGVRRENLQCNIAAVGGSPNVLSELTWEEVDSVGFKTDAELMFWNRFFVEGSFFYGNIYDGQNQDSDFAGDNRTVEFSRSTADNSGDDVYDYSFGIGYQVPLRLGVVQDYLTGKDDSHLQENLWLAFMAGYSYHEQNYRMTNGSFRINTIGSTGPFQGLNSTYQTEWDGPWLGLRLSGMIDKIYAFTRLEYHWKDYYAQAQWNLDTSLRQPIGVTHATDAEGFIASVGGKYHLKDNWTLDLELTYQEFDGDPGEETRYLSGGGVSILPLNEVTFRSVALMVGSSYLF